MKSDEDLVQLCLHRDAHAWESLVQRHQDRILNLAFQFTGNREEARDLGQEIFVRLYQSLDRYQVDRPFLSWFHSVARNLCIDHYRRRQKDRRIVDPPVEDLGHLASGEEGADHKLERRELRERVLRALDTLGTGSREAIVLKDLQGHTLEEMAEMLGCPIGTVKSRISRARVELGRAILRLERGATSGAGSMEVRGEV